MRKLLSVASSTSGNASSLPPAPVIKAGRHVLPYLVAQGHQVLNLDLVDFPYTHLPPGKSIYTLKADLSDSGQAFNALTSPSSQWTSTPPTSPRPARRSHPLRRLCAQHARARQRVLPHQRHEHVQRRRSGMQAWRGEIVIAYGETMYGVYFAQGEDDFLSFPLDEDMYDVNPMDTYA
jgi:hypothetical protein